MPLNMPVSIEHSVNMPVSMPHATRIEQSVLPSDLTSYLVDVEAVRLQELCRERLHRLLRAVLPRRLLQRLRLLRLRLGGCGSPRLARRG
jgi:hypothetical protein